MRNDFFFFLLCHLCREERLNPMENNVEDDKEKERKNFKN